MRNEAPRSHSEESSVDPPREEAGEPNIPAGDATTWDPWSEFARKHAGNPALDHETLYALPEGLIDAIQERFPGFFSPQEVAFERDLANYSGGGFFLHRLIRHPIVPPPTIVHRTPEMNEMNERQRRAHERIHRMLLEEYAKEGVTESEIDQSNTSAAALQAAVDARRIGYTGWLVMNPEFQRDLRDFLRKRRRRIMREGVFPRVPESLMVDSPTHIPVERRPYYAHYMWFFVKWGLETMVSWELPLPMEPALGSLNLYNLESVRGGGILLYVPFFLLRDKVTRLQELATAEAQRRAPGSLKSWLNKENKKWGHIRYGLTLRLYLALKLGIERRYPERVRRKISKLDEAFGTFLLGNPVAGDDTIRKARQLMNRQLGKFRRRA